MGRCVSLWQKKHEGQVLDIPCGKCYECKANRVNGWSFRLSKEAEVSTSAFFVTLTYAIPPLSENRFMTLVKKDLQNYMKRLRKLNTEKLKYYAVGEYGTESDRPHYHIIIFNANIDSLSNAWVLNSIPIGHVHIGEVNEATVRYTLKYVSKDSKIPVHDRDDRIKEFSLMSKKMGSNYLTKEMVEWHRKDLLNRMYLPLKGGGLASMPRYYKEKIYTEYERNLIGDHLKEQEEKELTTYKQWAEKDEQKRKIEINKQKRAQKETRLTKL